MKTLTKSLIVAALAASTVAGEAAVVSFSSALTPVGTPATSYSGSFSGNYDVDADKLTLTGVSIATLVTFNTSGTPAPILSGTLTAAGGFSRNLVITPGSVSSQSQNVTIPLVGTYLFYINSQGGAFSSTGAGAAGNQLGPVQYTLDLSSSGGVVLSQTFTVVPEPEVYAGVAALGLAGFALWRRRSA